MTNHTGYQTQTDRGDLLPFRITPREIRRARIGIYFIIDAQTPDPLTRIGRKLDAIVELRRYASNHETRLDLTREAYRLASHGKGIGPYNSGTQVLTEFDLLDMVNAGGVIDAKATVIR